MRPPGRYMQPRPGVRFRHIGQAHKMALTAARGPRCLERALVTAGGHRDRSGADAGLYRRMGNEGGRRRVGALCGTAEHLSSTALVPHWARVSIATDTVVTPSGRWASGQRARGEVNSSHVHETVNNLWRWIVTCESLVGTPPLVSSHRASLSLILSTV